MMPLLTAMPDIDDALAARCHRLAGAERWGLPVAVFRAALERSARKASPATRGDLERHLTGLHLEDLALACACEQGDEAAWEHFVRQFRPALYRAAAAIDRTDNARDLADSIYAELYGVRDRGEARASLFRYFHGRSSLATWLRSVLAQRHVDRLRSRQRLEPLPDQEGHDPPAPPGPEPDTLGCVERVRRALAGAVARLAARDRLRLGWYYAQQMTLADIGTALGEHEATVSRQLSRARKTLRADMETELTEGGLSRAQLDECLQAAMDDPGTTNLDSLFRDDPPRKNDDADRSTSRETR